MVAAVKLEFLIKILPVYLNGRGQRQRSVTENVDNMWATADTEELNPKEDREGKKQKIQLKNCNTIDKRHTAYNGHFIS